MTIKNYNSNPTLKASGVSIQFTQEQIKEYIKCKDDPCYFIRNYCKIVSLDKGLINFHLFDYQVRFIETIHAENRIVSMQPRQMGKSQTVAAYILHYTIFNDNKTAAILANKASAAREILSRHQLMYENLPSWLQQGVTTWNKGDIKLENGSIIFTAATSGSGIRGKSVNFLYVDETSIIPNTIAEDFFTSTYPTISSGKTTKIVLTSTPLGYNHFWHFWQGAEQKTNGFVPVRVHYWEHPDRDEAWANKQRELLGETKFNQEILCSFLGSSYTLIRSDIYSKLPQKAPIFSKDGVDILYSPIKNTHTYIIVVDVSQGVGADYSAFSVIDVTELPYRVVAKYRNNKISPLLYPNVIYKVAREYNDAFVLTEVNFSSQVAQILYSDLEYENILMVNKHPGRGQFISSGFGSKSQMGVTTDKKVKRIGCTNFKSLVEEHKLIIEDADIISEISTFIEKGGSYQADDGYHDDLVMTLVLFSWLTSDTYFKDLTNINMRQIMYQQKIEQIEEDLTPFGFIVDGTEEDVKLVNF